MIRFHNCKKLFLLLLLLLPISAWSMEENESTDSRAEDEQPNYFYLVVSGENNKAKCRILHRLLSGCLVCKVDKESQTYQDLQKVQVAYNALGVRTMIHTDFEVKKESEPLRRENKRLRRMGDEYPFEDVVIYVAHAQRKSEIEEQYKQLPFEATVYTKDELDDWHARYLCEQYESIDTPLLDLND